MNTEPYEELLKAVANDHANTAFAALKMLPTYDHINDKIQEAALEGNDHLTIALPHFSKIPMIYLQQLGERGIVASCKSATWYGSGDASLLTLDLSGVTAD